MQRLPVLPRIDQWLSTILRAASDNYSPGSERPGEKNHGHCILLERIPQRHNQPAVRYPAEWPREFRRLASAVYYTAFPFSYPHGLKYCARFNAICGARYLKLTNGLKSLQERTAKTFRVIGDGLRMSQGALRSVRPYKGEITLKQNQSRNRHRLKVAACP